MKEVRLLSQLSHPAVVRYYNTWLEEVYDASDVTDEDASTEAGTAEFSRGSFSKGGFEIEFATSQGGLDFISSSRHLPSMDNGFAIEFEGDSEAVEDEDDDDDEEDYETSESDEESEDGESGGNTKALAPPRPRRDRRSSYRPFRTVMYISMEYCEKRVS